MRSNDIHSCTFQYKYFKMPCLLLERRVRSRVLIGRFRLDPTQSEDIKQNYFIVSIITENNKF